MIDVNPIRLSAIVSEIYEAASEPASWSLALESLRQVFHGSKACIQRIGPDIRPDDNVTTNPDPLFVRLLDEHANQPNVLVDAVSQSAVGAVYHDHALVGGDGLRRSRFWNDWMAPQDMHGGLGVKVLEAEQSYWIFDVQRGSKANSFEPSDAEFLGIVAPHIMRALKINRNFQSVQTRASTFQHAPFGLVLVDAEMKIAAANAAAEALLSRHGTGLFRVVGRLTAADARSMARLKALVLNACSVIRGILPGSGGDLLIKSGNDVCGDLALSVAPLAGISHGLPLVDVQAAIFVREISLGLPMGFESQLRSLFGLTAREADIAIALASGLKLRTAADNAGIKFSTARSYLEKVFLKTGTHKQSQLVGLLKSVVPSTGKL